MTREERELSITYLEGIKEEYIEGYGYERHPLPEYYAIETAIKALEQEPCEDAVNRQAVCEFLENHAKTYDDVRVRIGLKAGSSLVANPDNVPSVTPTRKKERWIPVSERLPKDKIYVLTTIKIPNRIAHVRSGWYEGGFIYNDNGDVWKATDMEVIAWMPLPDPYKAESEV